MMMVIQLDGWKIAVDWDRLYYRHSFFIPSVNLSGDRAAISASAKKAGKHILIVRVVENEIQGLRIWRDTL